MAPKLRERSMEGIALRLHDSLVFREMSVTEFVTHIGVTRATVYNWLKGISRSIDAELIFLIARVLQVDATWLSTGVMPPAQLQRVKTTREGGQVMIENIDDPEQSTPDHRTVQLTWRLMQIYAPNIRYMDEASKPWELFSRLYGVAIIMLPHIENTDTNKIKAVVEKHNVYPLIKSMLQV